MKKLLVTLLLVGTVAVMGACGTTADPEVTPEVTPEISDEVGDDLLVPEEDDLLVTPDEENTDAPVGDVVDITTVLTEGTSVDILNAIYQTAELNADLKGQIDGGAFGKEEVLSDTAEMFLGSADIEFDNAVYSAPMMSSIAYQVVVLQVAEGQDVEATKTALLDNADPSKWVCVVPDAVVAESIDNTILFIMADQETTDALILAFQNLVQE